MKSRPGGTAISLASRPGTPGRAQPVRGQEPGDLDPAIATGPSRAGRAPGLDELDMEMSARRQGPGRDRAHEAVHRAAAQERGQEAIAAGPERVLPERVLPERVLINQDRAQVALRERGQARGRDRTAEV